MLTKHRIITQHICLQYLHGSNQEEKESGCPESQKSLLHLMSGTENQKLCLETSKTTLYYKSISKYFIL